MKKRLLTVSALGVLLAFGAVGCGGDDSAALDNWAKSVCESAQGPIGKSSDALADTGRVKPGEAPADLQKRLSTDLATLATANQQLADAIDKAGAPKVSDGAKLQQGAVDELKQASQGYLDVQKKLNALPNDDQARFADGLRSVGDQVQRLAQQSTTALKNIQSGDLGTAIGKQPGCKAQPGAAATGASTGAATGAATGATGAAGSGASAQAGAQSSSPSASASDSPSVAASSAAPSDGASDSASASPSASASGN
ncbi:small secreted protein [Kitasatospora sp. HPMI-4]|uniref:small secreted protein n=1 Tax=Kitasatospora sp. HPMI-4 TaxID=3448443 RepID=UPI003F1E09B4